MVVGAALFHHPLVGLDWSYVDAFYFSFSTLSTILGVLLNSNQAVSLQRRSQGSAEEDTKTRDANHSPSVPADLVRRPGRACSRSKCFTGCQKSTEWASGCWRGPQPLGSRWGRSGKADEIE